MWVFNTVYINLANLTKRYVRIAKPCAPIAQLFTEMRIQVNQFAKHTNINNVDVTVVNTALTNLIQLSSGGGSVNINQVRQACTLLRVHCSSSTG